MSTISNISNSTGPYVSYASPKAQERPIGCAGKKEGNTVTAYNPWGAEEYAKSPAEKVKVTETQVTRRGSDGIFINLKLSNGAEIFVQSSAIHGVSIVEHWVDSSRLLSLSGNVPNKYGSWRIDGKSSFVHLTEGAFKKDCSDKEIVEEIKVSSEEEPLNFLSSSVTPAEQMTMNELEEIYSMLPEDNAAKSNMKTVIERARVVSTSGWGNNVWRTIVGF